jgi:hypothetical protein
VAMRREIADLRTTFSVAGVRDVVDGAKAAATGLDSVAAASARQAAAAAAAARDTATAQAAAARAAAASREQAVAMAQDAVRVARQRHDELVRLAEDELRVEADVAKRRETLRTQNGGDASKREADLARERERIDTRAEARRALLDRARQRAAELQARRDQNLAKESEAKQRLQATEAETPKDLEKRAYAQFEHAGEDAQEAEYQRLLRERMKRVADGRREVERLTKVNATPDPKLPAAQLRLSRAEAVDAGRTPRDEARKAQIDAEIQAVRAAEADKVTIVRKSRAEEIAAARQALEFAQDLLDKDTAAAEAAAAARTRAVQQAAAAEAKARREAASASAQADADAARERAKAEVAAQAATDRQGAGGDTAAAVRAAEERHERTKREAADRIRREQAQVDTQAADRRDAGVLKKASDEGVLRNARAKADALRKQLADWEKANKGRREGPEKEAERADLQEQLNGWVGTAASLKRNQFKGGVASKRAEEDAQRDAAERMRLFREVEEARVAASARALDEVRRILAQETIAAKEAAAQQAEAAKEAARARAKAAAEGAAAVARVAATAKAAADKAKGKRELDETIAAGMVDPDALRAKAKSSAEDHAAYAAKVADRLRISQAKVAGARGTDREAEVAEQEARSAKGIEAALMVKERAANRFAAALVEVERRLKAVQAEADRLAKAQQGEAERVAASIDKLGASARKVQGDLAGARRFERDVVLAKGNARQTEGLAKAWADSYERAVARVVKAAAEAKVAIAAAAGDPEELARVTAAESEKVQLAQRTADRIGGEARRMKALWAEVDRAQQRSASDAARAQEAAARRSARAWEDAMRRLSRVQSALPKFGDGAGRARRAGGVVSSAVGAVGSLAGTVLGGALGILRAVASGAAGAARAVLNVGVAAVTAAGRIVLWLGSTALSVLARLGQGAFDVAKKVASIGRTVIVRAVLIGGAGVAAGAAAARKAVADSAEATKGVVDGAMATGSSGFGFQQISAAARRAGLDMAEFQGALTNAHKAMASLGDNPTLLAALNRFGIATRDMNGRLRDTGSVIQDLMSRIQELSYAEQGQILTELFGSPEDAERMLPLLAQMARGAGALNAATERQRQLGSLIGPGDVAQMRAYRAAVYDLEDAWKGLKLAVARAVGPDVISGYYRLSNLIAASRGTIAAAARYGFILAQALAEVVITGNRLSQFITADTKAASVARLVLDGAYYARRFAIEMAGLTSEFVRTVQVINQQQSTSDQLSTQARGWVRALAIGVVAVKTYAVETVAAVKGIHQQMHSTAQVMIPARQWIIDLVAAGFKAALFFREVWRTIRGEDQGVVRYPWLLTIRAGLETLGRFAMEVWAAVRGDTAKVQEFPILLRIRSGVLATFQYVKDFASEAWQAVTGNGVMQQSARFPWLFSAAQAVRDFVRDVRAGVADLQGVWSGMDPTTAIGAKFQNLIATVNYYKNEASLLWQDFTKIFDGTSNKEQDFNFGWMKDLAVSIEDISAKAKEAWETFKGFYGFLDRSIQRLSFGKLDLATVSLTLGFLTLFGVTRVVIGGLKAMMLAGSLSAKWFGRMSGMAGKAEKSVRLAGTAATAAGGAAAASAGKWAALSGKLSGVANLIGRSRALQALLGLGAGALMIGGEWLGDKIASNADPENGTGRGWAMAGGAMQGAATGAMIGSFIGPEGTAAGAVIGGIYGLFSGGADYNAKRLEAVKEQLRAQGRGDLADRVSAEGITSTGDEATDRSDRESYSAADGEVERDIGQLKEVLGPLGQDLSGLRESLEARGTQLRNEAQAPAPVAPQGDTYVQSLGAMTPEQRKLLAERQQDANTLAYYRSTYDMRRTDPLATPDKDGSVARWYEQKIIGLQSRILELDRRIAAPAPVAAPAPAAAPGRRSANDEPDAAFIIKMTDGRELKARAGRSDVASLKDALTSSVGAPAWSV